MDRVQLGRWAEQQAVQFLQRKGYEVLDRNYRKPWGEIDIIAQKHSIIVFVEVKANNQFASGFEPELRANYLKQQRVLRTARTFLAEYQLDERPWQIDVISVTIQQQQNTALIKHFKNI